MTLEELQKRIASMIDQDSDAPTAGGDDWNLRKEYINWAQREWAESYQWLSLYKEINTLTSQSTGNATVSMPSDFRKFDGYLKVATSEGTFEYPQIDPQKRSQYADTSKYFYVLGDASNGYNMVINPSSHGSGASIFYSYWSTPNSLTSPADETVCPDPNYLLQKSIYYLWEARDDARFTFAKAEADMILRRMLEFEQIKGHSYDDRIQTREESKYGFRLGRD